MTKMTEAAFEAIVLRSGLPLTQETKREIYQATGYLEEMIARVTRPKPREAEPAIIFVPEQRG
jgi:hypothetical protein